MDYQIKELIKQGVSRHEIFEQLKKQSSNQMRLANKIATFELDFPQFSGQASITPQWEQTDAGNDHGEEDPAVQH